MIKRILYNLILISLYIYHFNRDVAAQQFRPTNLNWYEFKTEHFRLIYHDGLELNAKLAASILEQHYDSISAFTGGTLSNFPVVLNGYNDLSNGFVSPFNFRMEVEAPPIKGKQLNPQTGNWFEMVFPHELVHATHFNVIPSLGLGGFVNLFYPDMARSLHFAAPNGFHEGIAVLGESILTPGISGRGNYPYFNSRFYSVMTGSNPWSLGAMTTYTTHTQPSGRHYLGGYQFYSWVEETYGPESITKLIDFTNRAPFLGHAIAFKYATGDWPFSVYSSFLSEMYDQSGTDSKHLYHIVNFNFAGESIHSPYFLDEHTLLFYAQFYNVRNGFHTYNLKTGALNSVLNTSIVEDYHFSYQSDINTLIFARYQPASTSEFTYKAIVQRFDLNSRKLSTISDKRVYHPIPISNGSATIALQTYLDRNSIVKIENDIIEILYQAEKDEYIYELTPNPKISGQWALVINRGGYQGIYIVDESDFSAISQLDPHILFESSNIFDVHWHKSGKKFLFTSDANGTNQIYEHDIDSATVTRLSDLRFGAMEASYSPDDSMIAFITYSNDEQKLGFFKRESWLNLVVDSTLWKRPVGKSRTTPMKPEIEALVSKPYQPVYDWLKPRGFIPYYNQGQLLLENQIGALFVAQDVLYRHQYISDISYSNSNLWYNFDYRFSGIYPGLLLNAYREPLVFGNTNDVTLLVANRGFSAGLFAPYTIDSNLFFTGLYGELKVKSSTFKTVESSFPRNQIAPVYLNSNITSVNVLSVLSYKIYQPMRAFQPLSGVQIYAEFEQDINNTRSAVMRKALAASLSGYVPISEQNNESLKLSVSTLLQSKQALTFSPVSFFGSWVSSPISGTAPTILMIDSNYSIPLIYPETGGFTLPWYLQNIHMAVFGKSIINLDKSSESQHLVGTGLKITSGLSTLRIEIGVAYIYDISSNQPYIFIGDF